MDVQTLFTSGDGGYHTYRIPSLILTGNGDLLAICEGRRDSSSDTGQIDLLMKRSGDGGRSWSDQGVVITKPDMTCGNPCPVLDPATGALVLVFCQNRSADSEKDIKAGKASRTIWVMKSDDHGQTFSAPVEITPQVKKNTWTWYATGPGHGLALSGGRLVIPCDHNVGIRHDDTDPFGSHLIYSDDHGDTWRIGAILSLPGNECCALELDDGTVYLNCRTRSTYGVRSYGFSRDGGLSFLEEGFHEELVEPRRGNGGCEGSLLKLPRPDGGASILLFCNPATSEEDRKRLAIHVSRDQGRTWTETKVIHPGPAAYSDLAMTADGTVVCLYEGGEEEYKEGLQFCRFRPEEVLG